MGVRKSKFNMGNNGVYIIGSVLAVSAVSLIGITFLIANKKFFAKVQVLLVSFAIGSLLGSALLHLIPESLGHAHNKFAPLLIIVSMVLFFVIEKYFHLHRHHHPANSSIKVFGPLNLIADGFHNFLDGILIAAAYRVDTSTGIIATMAVISHELPQEIGDFAVLVKAGYSTKKALLFNLLSALASVVGAVLVMLLPGSSHELEHYILPMAGGGFLYIALANLVPELSGAKTLKNSTLQVVFILSGIAVMWFMQGLHIMHH